MKYIVQYTVRNGGCCWCTVRIPNDFLDYLIKIFEALYTSTVHELYRQVSRLFFFFLSVLWIKRDSILINLVRDTF